jgi:hypothetical protein
VVPRHQLRASEIEDTRWFARDRLISHADDNLFRLPRFDSVARPRI